MMISVLIAVMSLTVVMIVVLIVVMRLTDCSAHDGDDVSRTVYFKIKHWSL